ncbi:MAG TPA: 5'-3' exonuclease H3TH domain-containing protein [Polyangiaceae bacterium]|nr:5'-3' exonuclease H3TH domain-containing protein [Polyangiaceae bacterium]
MKVHLVDGTYELFRAYYAVPSALDADGREMGAVRALLGSLLALLRQPDVTHVAVAFDHVIESFRNQLFAGYKTGEGIDPALWSQFEPAEAVCRALGLVVWPMVEFEADDALATAARLSAEDPAVAQVVLCTPDKDLAQCVVGDRVVLFDRRRDLVLNEAAVIEKFGVPPRSIPDWLALVGDSADGIPGIAGWGPKSAATVLAAHETVAAIPDDAARWSVRPRGATRLAATLAAEREAAELYRVLATLRTDVPLGSNVADWRWRGPVTTELQAWCERLRDPSLCERAAALASAVSPPMS